MPSLSRRALSRSAAEPCPDPSPDRDRDPGFGLTPDFEPDFKHDSEHEPDSEPERSMLEALSVISRPSIPLAYSLPSSLKQDELFSELDR